MLKFKEKIFITAIAILLLSASIVRAEIALSFSSNCASPVGFNGPFAIACDSSGYYYVVDTLNNRIQKFDSNWTFIKQWGQYGYWNGEFMYPRGIAIDDTGN
ncbi:MAG TPA: 6-bladed beta-propeller, partial [bacterium]|nr:6-bladed beta-propeller [bacterium]